VKTHKKDSDADPGSRIRLFPPRNPDGIDYFVLLKMYAFPRWQCVSSMTTYLMSLLSARSISLVSTSKGLKKFELNTGIRLPAFHKVSHGLLSNKDQEFLG
jgi:hypothetical protein